MNAPDLPLPNRTADDLRQAFDRSFAEAPRAETALFDDFLAIRLGADPHVVAVADISRLSKMKTLTRLPSEVPELLGIAGIGGAIVAVYDLRALLGYPASNPPRWMVVCAAMPVALAFDAFDGQFRHPREVVEPAGAGPARPRILLRGAEQAWPVVPVASILATIKARALDAVPKER